jgi:phosphoribosylformylglycinamidine synthase
VVGGRPPLLDLARERSLHEFLQEVAGIVRSAHDLSKGGLAMALAESALAGGLGFAVSLPAGEPHRVLFSESPSRAVVSCEPSRLELLEASAVRAGLRAVVLGAVGGSALDFGVFAIDVDTARDAYENGLERALSASMDSDGRRS